MPNRKIIILLSILSLLTLGYTTYTGYFFEKHIRESVNVSNVIDGDTIGLSDGRRVRLLGINTPEKNENFYQQAKDYLAELVENKEVSLESFGKDKYGRTLGYIYINNTLVNLQIIKKGLGSTYLLSTSDKLFLDFKEAEKEAKDNQLGIWKSASITCLSLINFHYNADGDDNSNLNDEYVVFRNTCDHSLDMSNWEIKDEGTNIYKFKAFIVPSQSEFTLYSGPGKDSTKNLYWKSKQAVWNNDKDTLFLKDANGNLVLSYAYPN